MRAADEVFSRQRQAQSEAETLKSNPLRNYDTSSLSLALPTLPAPPSSRKPPRPKAATTSHFVMQPWICPADGQEIKDAKGNTERRMFPWDAIFKADEEWSFEELRARQRGILGKEYRKGVQDWERAWHEPGASTPQVKPAPRRAPSPTFNTKLANEEVARMFDQTIHGGKIRDSDSDSDESSSDDEARDIAPMSIEPKFNPISMLSPGSGMVPPTPTPAQGTAPLGRSMMVFADENAVAPRSAPRPAKFNVFAEARAAKTPLASRETPALSGRALAFDTFEEVVTQPEEWSQPRLSSNPFTVASPVATRKESTSPITEAVEEEEHAFEGHNVGMEGVGDEDEVVNDAADSAGEEDEGYQVDLAEEGRKRHTRGDFVPRMSTISERTMEYTQITDRRASTSAEDQRLSMASSVAADDAFVASDPVIISRGSRSGLDAVAEEAERSLSRSFRRSDSSSTSATSPRARDSSGSIGSGFHLPEGYTIHGQNAGNTTTTGHTIGVSGAFDTMHTARETSPEADTRDFVTAQQSSELANPCNPCVPEVISTLLCSIEPPLSSLAGFVDMRHATSNRMDGLNRFAKNKIRRNSSSGNASRSSMAPEEGFALDLDGRLYEVLDKIGEGGFGAVFLAADVEARNVHDDADSDDEDEESGEFLVAIKAERPPTLWEAVILDRIHRRLDPAACPSFIRPQSLFAFADESFLILDYASQGTLLDAVNKASSMGIAPTGGTSALDEMIAIFFTIELLRAVEDLHNVNFIHGDLKIDNCLIRLGDVPSTDWSAQYSRAGQDCWADKGVKLIDFGRAIDLELFPAGTAQTFVGEWETDQRDCVEMREGRAWSYQTDYSGLASICYCMLFGKYITTERGENGRYRISTTLKRVGPAGQLAELS